jgi:hypothetical protein
MNDYACKNPYCEDGRISTFHNCAEFKEKFREFLRVFSRFSSDVLGYKEDKEERIWSGNRFDRREDCERFEEELLLYLRLRAYLSFRNWLVTKKDYVSNIRVVYSYNENKWVVSSEKNKGILALYIDTLEHAEKVANMLNYSKVEFDNLFSE